MRILILSAGFGEGHNAAARNLAAALREKDGSADVRLVDLFHEAHPRLNRLSRKLYGFAISRLPRVWNLCFRLFDRTTIADAWMARSGGVVSAFHRQLKDFSPDVLVSVYPGYGPLVAPVARARRIRLITVITDSITVNRIWHRAGSDAYVVANDATAEVLKADGVSPTRIFDLGFPVPLAFADLKGERAVPPPGKWKVMFMVNSHGHKAARLARQLLRLPNVELSIAVGQAGALGRKLKAIGESEGRPLTIIGWSSAMPQLMAEHHVLIAKAGGATTQETLAAGTPMIIHQVVPGQEEGNARLVKESGAGVVAEDSRSVVKALQDAFAQDGAQWKSWESAAKKLGRPRAARDIAAFVLAARGSRT